MFILCTDAEKETRAGSGETDSATTSVPRKWGEELSAHLPTTGRLASSIPQPDFLVLLTWAERVLALAPGRRLESVGVPSPAPVEPTLAFTWRKGRAEKEGGGRGKEVGSRERERMKRHKMDRVGVLQGEGE